VALQGWSKEAALEEMTRGGFGFHERYDNLIEYLRELDVEAMKRRAGLIEPQPAERGR
jgi:GTP cyclohydrolase III